MPTSRPVLTLIDASGFIFRAYHAIPPLTTSKGVPTNAVYGFTRMVLKTLRELKPTHVALAFDKESRTGRQEIDPNYKANREGPPPRTWCPSSSSSARWWTRSTCRCSRWPGWEADDVIGTLAKRAKAEGFRRAGGHRRQGLHADRRRRTCASSTRCRTSTPGPREVKERLGIEPGQMRDYLALVGDAIDNVPKVPGHRPQDRRRAASQQFGDVEALLARLDEVKKPKIREALAPHRESLLQGPAAGDASRPTCRWRRTPRQLAAAPIDEERAPSALHRAGVLPAAEEMPPPPGRCRDPADGRQTHGHRRPRGGCWRLAEAVARRRARLAGAGLRGAALRRAAGGPGAGAARMTRRLRAAAPPGARRAAAVRRRPARRPGAAARGRRGCKKDGARPQGARPCCSLGAGLELHGPRRRRGAALVPAQPVAPGARAGRPGARAAAAASCPRCPPRRRQEGPGAGGPCSRGGGRRRMRPARTRRGGWPPSSGRSWTEAGLAKLARELELPLVPVLAQMERRGVKLDLAVLADDLRARWMRECEAQLSRSIHQLAGARVQRRLQRRSWRRCSTRSSSCRCSRRARRAPPPIRRCWRSSPSSTRCRGAILEYRIAVQAQEHLPGHAAAAGGDGRAHPHHLPPGGHRHRAAVLARIPTCRTSPSAPSWAGRSAAPSSPSRATSSSPPTTARSSCGCWRTSPRIPASSTPSQHDEDVHSRTAAEIFGVAAGPGDRGSAPRGQDGELRHRLRPVAARAVHAAGHPRSRRRASIIERYFTRYAGIRRYLEETVEQAPEDGLRGDAVRPAAAHGGSALPQPAGGAGRRARRDQHAHPGHRGGPHQDGHARASTRRSRRRGCARGCCCRCTTSCSSRRPTPRWSGEELARAAA